MPNPAFDPPASTRAEVEEKLRTAREIVGALDRALRTRRMYQPDHPLFVENTQELLTRMIEFFDRFSYLRLEITPTELRIEGRTLVQAPAHPQELPFRLYKDGIREIRFHRGLSREELLDFVGIMELTGEDLVELSEDYVSLLWSRDFKSIDYVAVDEFELAEDEVPPDMDPKRARVIKDIARRIGMIERRIATRELDPGAEERRKVYRMGLDETSLAFPAARISEVEDTGVLGTLQPIENAPEPPPEPPEGPALSEVQLDDIFLRPVDESIERMRREIDGETLGGAVRRSLDILAKLHGDGDRTTVVEVDPLLRGVVGFYVRKGDFGCLGHILSHLQQTDLLAQWSGGRALWDLLVEAVRRPDLKKPLLAYLNRLHEDDPGVRAYFKIVGPAFVRLACQLYIHVHSTHGRAILRDYLVEFGVAEPQAFRELIDTAAERHLAEIFDIVREVRPPGVALDLEACLHHPSPSLRQQAMAIAAKGEGPLRIRYLQAGLADADATVRAHTLRAIGDTRDPALRMPLQDWIERRDFADREAVEKELAMRALARVGGAAAYVFLKGVAARPAGVFQKSRGADTRRAAVMGLKELATLEAYQFLRTAAEGEDKELAAFARVALARSEVTS
ncbi:MAG: HEAT repeat domain-containing protein [Planctomycetes bacterium]|nr:HEAT repeat domain-containing protein [Planctomycetota bacterium]